MSETLSVSYPAISTSTNVCENIAYSVSKYELPGFGVRRSNRCNEPSFVEYCPDCHHTEAHFYHCNRWDCPVCYPWTANKRARESATRIWGVYMAWLSYGEDVGFLNHLVISVPPSEYDDFDEKSYAAKARKRLKEIGVSGGLMVFHPYRIIDEVEDILRLERQSGDLKVSNWIAVHQNYLQGSFLAGHAIETWHDYVEFSPHWHVIGFFKLKERSDSFYDRTGWTYKNVSWEKYHAALDKDGAKRTIAYLCTHHRIQKGKQSVTYFGVAAPNKVTRTTTSVLKVSKCPNCAADFNQMAIDGSVSETISKGDLYRIPVRSQNDVDELLEVIRIGKFKFRPEDYRKCWYPEVHYFYTVRTDFSRHVKPVEIVDDARCDDKLDDCSYFREIRDIEEEKLKRKSWEDSLPPYDVERLNKHRIG